MLNTTDSSTIESIIASEPTISLKRSSDVFESQDTENTLPVLAIETSQFSAAIAIQGAQLLTFNRKQDDKPLLWCSPNALFKQGKAVRGGIPICFPWFGAHPTDNTKPNHGFVRDNDWQLQYAQTNAATGSTTIRFSFASTDTTLALFPHNFLTELEFTLSDKVEIKLSVHNQSSTDMPCSWAMHSYLPVDTLSQVEINGLDGVSYLDTTGTPSEEIQSGSVTLNGEVDRVYKKVGQLQTIHSKHNIDISGDNCPTAIVWNPGVELAASMADLGEVASTQFVCLERGAAFTDAWSISPNEIKTATVSISASEK